MLTKVSEALKIRSKSQDVTITEALARKVLLEYCKNPDDLKEEKLVILFMQLQLFLNKNNVTLKKFFFCLNIFNC